MDHIADESFVPVIIPLLDDPVGKVRRHAVHALTCEVCKPDRCGLELSQEIKERLERVAQMDEDIRVQSEARGALERWDTV